MSLQYTAHSFDRNTGELVALDLGIYMTVTEFTTAMGVPMKLGRAVLLEMGLLGIEGGRLRLRVEYEAAGLGKRLKAKTSKFPFDVLSPAGQDYARRQWEDALTSVLQKRSQDPSLEAAERALNEYKRRRIEPMTTQQEVYWLLQHYPALSRRSIARLLNVTEAIVFKWSAARTKQIKKVRSRRACPAFP